MLALESTSRHVKVPKRVCRRKPIIIEDHMGLVFAAARKYTKEGEAVEDSLAFSDGCLGLIRAVENYVRSYGPFPGYATRIINNAIVSGYRWRNRKRRSIKTVPIDEQDDDLEVFDSSPPLDIAALLERLLLDVSLLDKKFLKARFIRGKSYRDIGKKYGLTAEGVRLKVQKIIKQIREKNRELLEGCDEF